MMKIGELRRMHCNIQHLYHDNDAERRFYERNNLIFDDVFLVLDVQTFPNTHSVRVLSTKGIGWISDNDSWSEKIA